MIVNLKALNESLENLIESNMPLTERFDDSFPKWLKDRLVKVKKSHGQYNDYKDVPPTERPDYINARGENSWDPKTMSLFYRALDNGIDLTQVKVVEGPIPAKRTDERLKEPNIPVWLFKNGQVYIEGVNDNEIYKPMDKAFKYIPVKYKLAEAESFAHIDGSKINRSSIADKRTERANLANDLKNMNYGRYGKDPEKFVPDSWRYSAPRDKSGYLINPNKYKKALSRLKAKNIYQELDYFHDKIEEFKDKISDVWLSTDIFSYDGNASYKIRSLMSDLDNAVENYNRYCRNVEDILDSGYDEDYKLDRIAQIVSNMRNNTYIQDIAKSGADVFLSEIDWD